MPKKLILACALAVPPIAALTNVAMYHHAGIVLSHYFGGRAANCSLAESFQAESLSRMQRANVDAIEKGSHVVRTDGQYQLWNTPSGDYWIPLHTGPVFYDLGEQQRNIYGTNIHAGDIVLDAGANVGVFTRKALLAGASKIIAIEPGPENLECLRRTFASEIADGRVVVYPKGVWDKEDVLKFSVDPADSAKDSFVRPIENAQVISVPLTTVDLLAAELHLPRVDFIKMDIEGAETRALKGAKGIIAQYHPRMAICTYHVNGDEVRVPQIVHETYSGYKFHKACFCAENRIVPEVAFFD